MKIIPAAGEAGRLGALEALGEPPLGLSHDPRGTGMRCPHCWGEIIVKLEAGQISAPLETRSAKTRDFDGQKVSTRAMNVIRHFKADNWAQLASRYNHSEAMRLDNVGRVTRQEIVDCLRRHIDRKGAK